MRFANLFSIAALVSGTLVSCAPSPAPAAEVVPVEARTTPPTLLSALNTANAAITGPCNVLGSASGDTLTLVFVQAQVQEITSAINVLIAQVETIQGSTGLLSSILGIFGTTDDVSVCTLLANLCILIMSTLATVCGLLTDINRADCLPLLVQLGCLVADLLQVVLSLLGIVGVLIAGIVGLLLGLLSPCLQYCQVLGIVQYWTACGIF